jgi:hypothetical protein
VYLKVKKFRVRRDIAFGGVLAGLEAGRQVLEHILVKNFHEAATLSGLDITAVTACEVNIFTEWQEFPFEVGVEYLHGIDRDMKQFVARTCGTKNILHLDSPSIVGGVPPVECNEENGVNAQVCIVILDIIVAELFSCAPLGSGNLCRCQGTGKIVSVTNQRIGSGEIEMLRCNIE